MIKFKHRYVESVPVTAAAGLVGKYLFSCNGMFDPNITGTGHQPMYFDQISPLFNHYCVIGSRIKVWMSTGSGTTVPYTYGVYIDDDSSPLTSYSDMLEQNSSRISVVAPQTPKMGYATAKWSARKTFGKSPLANTELQGTAAANPTEQSYFVIYAFANDLIGAVTAISLVEIEYIAIWKELIPRTGS